MQNFVRLPLEGAYNVRDMGGYPTAFGGMTAWRAFIRADDLHDLSKRDIDFLLDYGLKTVIDLRGADETDLDPNPFAKMAGIDYHNIPILVDKIDDITLSAVSTYKPQEIMSIFYVHILTEAKAAIRKIFAAIADAKDGAVLFHCRVGKDRTGIIAVLLLGLGGVSRADIITNYTASFHYIIENPKIIRMINDSIPDLYYSKSEYIESALKFIESEFGNTENYLRHVGLSDEQLEKIKNRLCVKK